MSDTNLQLWLTKTDENLIQSWNEFSFVLKVIQQLNKDFAPYSSTLFETDLKQNQDGKIQLIQQIEIVLNTIEKEDPASIPQLIYLIDLPEEIFQSVYQNSISINYDLAQCILIREAHKVWMRGRY